MHQKTRAPGNLAFLDEMRDAIDTRAHAAGSLAYMAPEQGRAEPVDGRTDVYACGVLLYELVTGRVPFSGETPMQVVMRHVNEPALPPSTFIPVHPDLEATIMKARGSAMISRR